MMQLRQQFIYYMKVMFYTCLSVHRGWSAYRLGGLHTDGRLPTERGVVYTERGYLPTEGEGVHLWGWTDPSLRPENWGLRILMECFLIATNILHGIHVMEIAPFEFLYWVESKTTHLLP